MGNRASLSAAASWPVSQEGGNTPTPFVDVTIPLGPLRCKDRREHRHQQLDGTATIDTTVAELSAPASLPTWAAAPTLTPFPDRTAFARAIAGVKVGGVITSGASQCWSKSFALAERPAYIYKAWFPPFTTRLFTSSCTFVHDALPSLHLRSAPRCPRLSV